MKIGALSLLNRTSSRRRFNLASWHSSHSLTWRWILSLAVQPIGTIRPYFRFTLPQRNHGHGGLSVGLGQLASLIAYRHNGGWQFSLALLWISLEFSQQESMFYRDMYRRERDRELEADFASQRPIQSPIVPDHPTLL